MQRKQIKKRNGSIVAFLLSCCSNLIVSLTFLHLLYFFFFSSFYLVFLVCTHSLPTHVREPSTHDSIFYVIVCWLAARQTVWVFEDRSVWCQFFFGCKGKIQKQLHFEIGWVGANSTIIRYKPLQVTFCLWFIFAFRVAIKIMKIVCRCEWIR